MRRTSYVPMLAALLALAACENPLGPKAVLDLELNVQADGFVPGEAIPLTAILRNPTARPVTLDRCALDVEVELPDGGLVNSPDQRWPGVYLDGVLYGGGASFVGKPRPCADPVSVAPWDSVVFHGTWTGYPAGVIPDSEWLGVGSTPQLPVGTYRLRPYLAAPHIRNPEEGVDFDSGGQLSGISGAEAVLYGPAKPLPLKPWTRVRFMHSYIGLPSVDVLVGGRLVAGALELGGLSRIRTIAAGTEPVEIRLAGAEPSVSTTSIQFSQGIVHTIVLRAGPQVPAPWDVTDTTTHPGSAEGALRVIHLASAAPEMAVFRIQPDRTDPVLVMSPFPYGTASPYALGSPGRWTVVVTVNGGTDTLLVAPVDLKGGELRTFLLMDDGQGGVVGPSIIP